MNASSLPKETTLNLRLDPQLKTEFAAAAKADGLPAAELLRSMMRDYVEIARRRQFAAEAHRQSQLLALSVEETKIGHWSQKLVHDLSGGRP